MMAPALHCQLIHRELIQGQMVHGQLVHSRLIHPEPVPSPIVHGHRLALGHRERGSGTVLAAGLALVVITAMAMVLLLAQASVLASRAASAADLAALAGADALRGISDGEPCTVAAEVAARHAATVVSCTVGTGQTLEIRTQLTERSMFGAATGRARAGPPP